jgi:hypothetical protein
MLDFFLRDPTDPNYRAGIYESRDEIENTITQIRMTLLTRKGEVLGEPNFGFDATGYLFEFEGESLDHIEKVADEQIHNYVMMSKVFTITAKPFTLNEVSDIHKAGLGVTIQINGVRAFAALYSD